MTVETPPKLMTADELLAMPDDDLRHELIEGVLITMSPAGGRHGKITDKIARRLGDYVEAHKLGFTYSSDTGFVLSRNPDTVQQPDVSFVRAERDPDSDGFIPGPPDLAVEVISPSDRYSEVRAKVGRYIKAATPMVIVVDPKTRTATVTTARGATELTIDDTLDGADVVPGWKLPLRELFE